MGSGTVIVPVTTEDGTTVHVEAVVTAEEGLQIETFETLDLKSLSDVIRVLAQNVMHAVQHTTPDKVTAELGLKLTAGTGGALKWVVDVSGEANISIGLEWSPGADTQRSAS